MKTVKSTNSTHKLGEPKDVQVIEYTDLPPLTKYRSGLSRKSFSEGIAYALPTEPGPLNFQSLYRVDLRAMFQDPYRSNACDFHEERLRAVSRLSHTPHSNIFGDKRQINRIMSKYQASYKSDKDLLREARSLSASSRRIVENLCHLSPSNKELLSPEKLHLRSKLHEPTKIIQSDMREKAMNILKELDMEIKDDYFAQENDKSTITIPSKSSQDYRELQSSSIIEREQSSPAKRSKTPMAMKEELRLRIAEFDKDVSLAKTRSVKEIPEKEVELRLQIAGLSDYDQIRSIGRIYHPELPASASSAHCSKKTNQKIWKWLTEDEAMNKFDYFMHLCDKQ